MRVLVTGGAGYVGTELIGALAAAPDVSRIDVYDNLSRRSFNLFLQAQLPPKPIRFIQGDILDSRKMERTLAGVDAVVHLAARVTTPFADGDPHDLEQVNHWGTAELSYILERAPVQRLIYLSSTSVYGSGDGAATHATVPQPQTWYGISKLRGERMLERLADQMRVHVLRCGNVYGYSRSMRFDAVINRFLFDAQFQRRISIHGDGSQGRAFIHVDHVAAALAAALKDDGLPSGTYNLVDRNLSVMEIAQEIQALIPELEMIYVEQDLGRRNLMVRPDPRIMARGYFRQRPFREELADMLARFSFAPAS